jgi:hypothetical protein
VKIIKILVAFISLTFVAYVTTKFKQNFPETYSFGQFVKNEKSTTKPLAEKPYITNSETTTSSDIGDEGE